MRWTATACLLALLLAATADGAARGAEFAIGYLGLSDDPRHAEKRTYTNLVLRPAIDPFDGARTALHEGRALRRIIGAEPRLERSRAKDAAGLAAKARELADRGIRLILLDAPGAAVAAVARATAGSGIYLFNVSSQDDILRGAECRKHLMHVVPSRAMLADALAQYVAARKWRDVLVLQGPDPLDAKRVAAFRRSAKRFGLEIVAVRAFTNANDPRDRNRNNPGLLTADLDYDLVFVADRASELGRHLRYRTKRPRPVIGSHGLVAGTWHWAFERHGAPQLNRRFQELAGRKMTGADWSAWAAVSLVIRAAARAGSTDAERIVGYLKQGDVTFDTYKGNPGSFRPWNNQLRQPILLHTADAVIGRAPVEGFLHPKEYLDTLGRDRPESECRLEND